jgi:hypothetical protein
MLLALGAILLAGGCGSDSSTATAVTVETGSLSRFQFIKRADEICKEGQAQGVTKLQSYMQSKKIASLRKLSDPQANELENEVIAPVYRREIAKISALGAPGSDREEIATMLEAINEGLADAQDEPLKALKLNLLLGDAPKLAGKYGLTECSLDWG